MSQSLVNANMRLFETLDRTTFSGIDRTTAPLHETLPHLLAVHNIDIAAPFRLAAQGREVGPGAGFGTALAPEVLAGEGAGKKAAFLRLGAEFQRYIGDHHHAEGNHLRRPGAAAFLLEDMALGDVPAGAAPFHGPGRRNPALGRQLPVPAQIVILGQLGPAVHLHRVLRDLAPGIVDGDLGGADRTGARPRIGSIHPHAGQYPADAMFGHQPAQREDHAKFRPRHRKADVAKDRQRQADADGRPVQRAERRPAAGDDDHAQAVVGIPGPQLRLQDRVHRRVSHIVQRGPVQYGHGDGPLPVEAEKVVACGHPGSRPGLVLRIVPA